MIQILSAHKPRKLTPAHQNALCLRCHAPEALAKRSPHAEALPALGVGCESCHGPAEKYLAAHYQEDFQSLSRKEKAEQYGLLPCKDLAFRVTMCASCHVGDADRDVNHDLLAAGHPRLAFEYTAFHRNPKYQRHWRETNYGSDFDARAWEIGQVACARAAARLLTERIQRATDRSWPELAEFSCFSCHKNLSSPSWKSVTAASRKPGSLAWGSWYFSALELATGPGGFSEIRDLKRLMENPASDRRGIVAMAKRLVHEMDVRLLDLQTAADQQSRVKPRDNRYLRARSKEIAAHALTSDRQMFRDLDWDGVTQHYLGVAAYHYSLHASKIIDDDQEATRLLRVMRDSLSFPKEFDSPKGVDPVKLIDLFRHLGTSTTD